MLSKKVAYEIKNSSATRKMYEAGLELKKKYGEEDVVDFSLGNPVLEPPDEFNKAVVKLVSSGKKGLHKYMPNAGYPHARSAIAHMLKRDGHFSDIGPEHVVMSSGAAGGISIALKSVLNNGEEVITIAPYFQEYRFYIKNNNGKHVPVDAAEDFSLDINAVEKAITKKTRALIINSPNNPTGVIYSKKSLEDFAMMLSEKEKSLKRELYMISDEPYREMVYEGSFVSPASLHKNSFMVYSWSKSLSLAAERLGYVAVNPSMKHKDDIVKGLAFCNKMLGFVNAPALMQNTVSELIMEGLDKPYHQYMRDYYKNLRDPLQKCLKENGYSFVEPHGAFFFFVKCPTPGKDFLLEEKMFIEDAKDSFHLLLVGGSAFGKPGWFRISYCFTPDVINRGCKKLDDVAKKYLK